MNEYARIDELVGWFRRRLELLGEDFDVQMERVRERSRTSVLSMEEAMGEALRLLARRKL